jgi:hypothetical protein
VRALGVEGGELTHRLTVLAFNHSNMTTNTKHVGHQGKNIAYHMNWNFRTQALRPTTNNRMAFNFHTLATDLKNWMRRKGKLRFSTFKQSKLPGNFTNPYTHAGSVLAISFAQVIQDSAAFSESREPMDQADAEIKRLRLYTEHVLYSARISECLIKQLLFCTDFRESDYEKAALSALQLKKLEVNL